MILGTAAYMAPEQARGRPVDKRADIWAFGVIVYEMLTGEQLFAGDSVTDVLASVVRQDPDLTRVPAKVRPLLERCLAKDPKRRLRDAGDAMLLLEGGTPAPAAAASSRTLMWAVCGAAALLAIGLAAVSYVHFREAPPAAEVVRFQIALPDNVNFTQFGVSAVSPDGRKIAFAAYGDDSTPRVWIRSLDSPKAVPLTEARINQQSAGFFWSPDSTVVAYGDSKQLRKISASGGPPETIAEIAPVIGGTWSPDGTILIGTVSGIMKVPASGGTLTPVTKSASEREPHGHPVLLPDGRHFFYLRGLPAGKRIVQVGDLNAAPDAQSTTPVVTTDYGVAVLEGSAGGSPLVLFLRNDTLFAQEFDVATLALTGSPVAVMEQVAGAPNAAIGHFSVSKNGTLVYRSVTGNSRQLTWFNRQGDVVGRPGEPGPYGTMKVSPDGTRAVVVQNDPRQGGNPDLWIVDLVNGASRRFTFDPGFDGQPVWSPDGRSIAWMGSRNNQMGLYRKAADGTGTDELLAAPEGFTNLTDWTHNGYLIFMMGGNVQALPVTADASGARTPIPVMVPSRGSARARAEPPEEPDGPARAECHSAAP
jgi:Tol biopolymer transport system component